MRYQTLAILLGAGGAGVAGAATPTTSVAPFENFVNNPVFIPPDYYSSWKTVYGRGLQLSDGSLLTTWESYPREPPLMGFPIYKSTDYGVTWFNHSVAEDQVNGWGLRYQPHLFTLPGDVGDYKAGTILLSGMSVKADLSEAWLDLYASTDNAESWTFVSHVVYAPGPESVPNGNKAVWEPFLVWLDGELILYYSDQRDPLHAQKLSHVTSRDLLTWSDPVDDVAHSVYGHRPGMAIVAHIKSTDQWIMVYEICNMVQGCPTYYKIASSAYDFLDAPEHELYDSATGVGPGSAPYVLWIPSPGKCKGLLLASGSGSSPLYVNDAAGDPDKWRTLEIGQDSAHSRWMDVINVDGEEKLMLVSGGWMSTNTANKVSVGIIDVPV